MLRCAVRVPYSFCTTEYQKISGPVLSNTFPLLVGYLTAGNLVETTLVSSSLIESLLRADGRAEGRTEKEEKGRSGKARQSEGREGRRRIQRRSPSGYECWRLVHPNSVTIRRIGRFRLQYSNDVIS